VVPILNEEKEELIATLHSLHDQTPLLLLCRQKLHVLVVIDGWWKASQSMKDYLYALFPEDNVESKSKEGGATGGWNINILQIEKGEDANSVDTFIVQRVRPRRFGKDISETICPVQINPHEPKAKPRWLHVSLMVKRDNRRKHNAHIWFLASFAPFYNSKVSFLLYFLFVVFYFYLFFGFNCLNFCFCFCLWVLL